MKKYNVILITLDDLNYNSLGCYDCPVNNISPNIDNLCSEGIKFENSFVTVSVCQPSRSSIMTGRYPFKNGARGFEDIDVSCTTLTEVLHQNGYYNAVFGKEDHLAPREAFYWDYYERMIMKENGYGRSPEKYYEHTMRAINNAQEQGKPFFMMANSHDPHRPFAGSQQEVEFFGENLPASYTYSPDEVNVKGFLPDIPDVRKEMAQYYTSVHRADETVGRIIDALKDKGIYDDSLILFLSDNGMAVPFSKTNCYLNSNKSPYILKLPKDIQEGCVDVCSSLITGIDITPTFLDILGLDQIKGVDGKSFVNCLYNNEEINTDIFTMFFKTAANKQTKRALHYPMRAVLDKQYLYVYNSWVDGKKEFVNESRAGLTFNAMVEVGKTDGEIQKRVDLYKYRVKQEFYSLENDKDCLINLIDNDNYTDKINKFKQRMLEYIQETQDGIINRYIDEVIK